MTPKQVTAFYGNSRSKTAERFGISYQSVKEWFDKGKVPAMRQLAVYQESKGKLKIDADARQELEGLGINPDQILMAS